MSPRMQSIAFRYGSAVLCVAVALAMKLFLEWLVASKDLPFLMFFGAIMAAGWRGGFGPGIFATLLSALTVDWLFYTRGRMAWQHTPAESFWMLVFVLEGTVLSLMCDLRNRMTERSRALNATLELRVAERTRQLESLASQLRWLAHELTQAEQRERRRVAEVLHDHLQQLLVAAKLRVSAAASPRGLEEMREVFKDVAKLLDESIQATRLLTAELRPPVLYEQGLVPALRWLAEWVHKQHALHVTVQIDPAAEPVMERNKILLFQCARELLFNIVKYAGVKEAQMSLSLADQDRCTCLAVEDKGRGFDPRALERPRDGAGGYGLFSISERLKVLGGKMEVRSRPGQGCRIELWVPRAEAPQEIPPDLASPPESTLPPPASAPGAGAAPHAVRVLLADDHQIVREGIANVLNGTEHITIVGYACDGHEAILAARRLRPDVVVMDLNMPRLNGLEATRQILSEFPQTCIIGLSVQGDDASAQALRQAGAAAYLNKDEAPQKLIDTILHCVDGSAPAVRST